MTRTLVLFTGLLIALVSVSGQTEAEPVGPGVGFGIKGGGNLANLFGDAVGNVEARFRLSGGAALRIRFNEIFSLQPEVLYSQKGAEQTEAVDIGGTQLATVEWKYDYIDVPILLDFKVPTEGAVAPRFYAGPTISMLMSAKVTGDGGELDLQDFTKSTDFGVTVGGAIDFSMGASTFVLDLRYVRSFNEFDDPPLSEIFFRKHNTITFMAGFRFGA